MNNVDPNGLECITKGNRVACFVPGSGAYINFPRPGQWPDTIVGNEWNYHEYDIQVPLNGADPNCVRKGIGNNPTPGNPSPATPGGTLNNATPTPAQNFFEEIQKKEYLGYNYSPVRSYSFHDGAIIVNVTQPGHPLHPGYVARTVENGIVHNRGEGLGALQGRAAEFVGIAGQINGVWNGQTQGILSNCGCEK